MINKLSLSNFKCFGKEVEAKLSRFNIIYGKNGRGKSTIIQSLLILTQSIRTNDNVNILHLNGEMTSLGSFADVVNKYSHDKSNFRIGVEIDEEVINILFAKFENKTAFAKPTSLRVNGEEYVNPVTSLDENEHEIKSSMAQSGIKTFSLLKKLFYVSAGRIGPRNYVDISEIYQTDYVMPSGQNVITILAEKDIDFRERFCQELSFILSGATINVKEDTISSRIEILLDSIDNTDGFRPTNVGYGYSYVLPIVLQTMIAPPDSIIVIENPEAHLYPGAQARLVEFLVKYSTERNIQFILETHSDHIINGIRISVKKNHLNRKDVSILFLDRELSNRPIPAIKHIKVDHNGTLSEEPTDFMDEWTKQMLELL